ncbi:MAG TPA: (Fe-S)-binding protein [Clostridia bacterium]|jgi:Fe-S oxidoreductase|nr:(Fe-S)-binding protein [Clostridia bacterium]HQO56227.1 (Fe-S)-binding protein [Clostridia bacterium]HUM61575.1 (Fe-S)-binding protein [Clostridia bacterium]
MFSEKAKKHADACRFCFMCRHLCPIQLVTGKENNTPRAKGLLVSMTSRGMQMDKGFAVTMYECLLCGACTADCVTGFDPLIFIREARTQAALEGLTPAFAQQVIDKLEETGNVYGAKETRVDFTGIPAEGQTLVWLGSAARYAVSDVAEALFTILKKAGVSFAALKDEPASGCELGDMIGHVEDVRQRAQAAAAAIAKTGAKKVIVLDSHDAAFFLHECKDWGIELPEIETATSFVNNLIKDGRLVPQKKTETVSYHDAARLARDLSELDAAREIIVAMGAELREMYLNEKDNTNPANKACGSSVRATECGSSLMGQMRPDLAVKLCENRYVDLLRGDARIMIAADPQATEALRLSIPEGCEYRDLFVMLAGRL